MARALSKLGYCSRSEAWRLIQDGRVCVNGTGVRDPERPVNWHCDRIEVEGRVVQAAGFVYLMLNKPRGLVTTASDERGRPTVFDCLTGLALPHVSPVGRLDQASEGLLLLTNDTAWANEITDPDRHVEKTYHVRIDRLASVELLAAMMTGVSDRGERLCVKSAQELRRGTRNCWLALVLDEGRNRHIRRLLTALEISVLRLVRVAVGSIELGELAKGAVRSLTSAEVRALATPGSVCSLGSTSAQQP